MNLHGREYIIKGVVGIGVVAVHVAGADVNVAIIYPIAIVRRLDFLAYLLEPVFPVPGKWVVLHHRQRDLNCILKLI